ncbi:MAG: hypothetical protein ACI4UH_00990 [Dorea sp.]
MERFLELLAPISMYFTAIMLLVLNVIETKQEKEEEEMREFKEKHEEIKKRWKNEER